MNKKYLFRTALCALVAMTSACSDEELGEEQTNGKQITITASDFKYADSSRTSIDITSGGGEFNWAENDTVGIFPNEGAQAYFPMINGAGTKTASFNGGGWALKPSSTYAAYYPYNVQNINPREISVSFEGQIQLGNATSGHLGNFDFMIAKATKAQGNNVDFYFKHLCCLVEFVLEVPMKGDVTEIRLSSDKKIFTNKGFYDLTKANSTIIPYNKLNSICFSLKDVQVPTDKSVIRTYFMLAPTNFTGQNINLEITNNGNKFSSPIRMGNLEAGKAYSFNFITKDTPQTAFVFNVEKAGTLSQIIGKDNRNKYSKLKLTGEINGTDLKFIYTMIDEEYPSNIGLKELDLYDVNVVDGGECYNIKYNEDNSYKELFTQKNIVGCLMFERCHNLTKIILPKSTSIIGEEAFAGCWGLQDIILPNTVSYIDKGAFLGCDGLKSFKIPDNVTYIGEKAFEACNYIETFFGPFTSNDNKSIIQNNTIISFANGIKDDAYDVQGNVQIIGEYAFQNSNLISIRLPNGLKKIGDGAFYGSHNLSSIQLPGTLLELGSSAFGNTRLKSIEIPNSVAHMGKHIFQANEYIETFYGKFASTDNKCLIADNTLIDYARGNPNKEYILKENINSIGTFAFSFSKNLETITMNNDVRLIEEKAFYRCERLKSIKFSDSIEYIKSYCFYYCRNLETVIFPKNLQQLGIFPFQGCYNLKSVTLPENLNYIEGPLISNGNRNFSILKCYAKEPPYIQGYRLTMGKNSFKIYVPKGSVEKYKAAEVWKDHATNIFEMPEGETYL